MIIHRHKGIGTGLNRRDALGVLGAIGAGVVVGCGDSHGVAPAPMSSGFVDAGSGDLSALDCILTPQLDEGPFFVDENLNRSDLVTNESDPGVAIGAPLALKFGVYAVNGASCSPLTGAHVDIWHADVNGLYSDTAAGFIQSIDTRGQNFLRAYQVVDGNGLASFDTIYPGWYLTRTIHVHVKIRIFTPAGNKVFEATTQMFFDDTVTDAVFKQAAYAARGPRSIPKNTNDQIYNGTGNGSAIDSVGPPAGQSRPGEKTIAPTQRLGATGSPAYLSSFKIGVKMA